jgi:hypothetical protein
MFDWVSFAVRIFATATMLLSLRPLSYDMAQMIQEPAIPQYLTIAANDFGSRLAPPTSAPSISIFDIKPACLMTSCHLQEDIRSKL